MERAEACEAFLVTRRGKPVAVVLPFSFDAEDLILAHAPHFIRLREQGRTDRRKGQDDRVGNTQGQASPTRSISLRVPDRLV